MPDPVDFDTLATSQRRGAQSFDAPALQPGLYIVATPIGNLRDITLRALDILASVDYILAEDTRHTQKLLSAYDIKTPMKAYHDHNVADVLPDIMDWLEGGVKLALVSDAGTPLVSDPGFKLVRAASEAGLTVFPVPGASALLAGLMVAGLPTDSFQFCGFLPNKSAARQRRLEALASIPATLVFFESPRRVAAAINDAIEVLGDRDAVIARELTKKFETILRGSLTELAAQTEGTQLKGEIVLLIGPPHAAEQWSKEEIDEALESLVPDVGVKQASVQLAGPSGWSRRDIYRRALKYK